MTTFVAIALLLSACSVLATPQPTPTSVPTPTSTPIPPSATNPPPPTNTQPPPPTDTQPPPPMDPTTARFEGTIYFSGEPFAGATVRLGDPSKDSEDPEHTIAEVTTDAEGSYSFVVDPGEYTLGVTLAFSESDYPCETQPGGLSSLHWIPIEDTSETDATKLTDPWLGAWGTQSDQSGAPLGLVLIAASDSITVTAGEVVQRDMFASCPQ